MGIFQMYTTRIRNIFSYTVSYHVSAAVLKNTGHCTLKRSTKPVHEWTVPCPSCDFLICLTVFFVFFFNTTTTPPTTCCQYAAGNLEFPVNPNCRFVDCVIKSSQALGENKNLTQKDPQLPAWFTDDICMSALSLSQPTVHPFWPSHVKLFEQFFFCYNTFCYLTSCILWKTLLCSREHPYDTLCSKGLRVISLWWLERRGGDQGDFTSNFGVNMRDYVV